MAAKLVDEKLGFGRMVGKTEPWVENVVEALAWTAASAAAAAAAASSRVVRHVQQEETRRPSETRCRP